MRKLGAIGGIAISIAVVILAYRIIQLHKRIEKLEQKR